MAKYSERMTDVIVSLIEEDYYSIKEICRMARISRKSFYEWRATKPEFRERINKALDNNEDKYLPYRLRRKRYMAGKR